MQPGGSIFCRMVVCQAGAALLEGSPHGFRLALSREPRDLVDQSLNVPVLDVQAHDRSPV
jgi:hypothetical protein